MTEKKWVWANFLLIVNYCILTKKANLFSNNVQASSPTSSQSTSDLRAHLNPSHDKFPRVHTHSTWSLKPPSSTSVYKNRKEYLKITNARKMTKKSCLRFWLVFGGFRSTVHTSHARPIAILLQPTKAFYCFKTFQNFHQNPEFVNFHFISLSKTLEVEKI